MGDYRELVELFLPKGILDNFEYIYTEKTKAVACL